MSFNGPSNLSRLCPLMGCGDVRWCNISVRPYCNDCGHWGPVNYGNEQDAIKLWHEQLINAGYSKDDIKKSTTSYIKKDKGKMYGLPLTKESKDTLKQMFLVDLKRVTKNIEAYMGNAKKDEDFFDIVEIIEFMGKKLKEIDEKQSKSIG